jgi:hypothetical protein
MYLQERRIALAEGRPVPQDLLGILLTAADEAGQAMTDEELWEDVHDVMGAGTPFSAGFLPFLCCFECSLCVIVDEAGQAMTDEELWEDVHDVMGAGTPLLFISVVTFDCLFLSMSSHISAAAGARTTCRNLDRYCSLLATFLLC